MTSNLGASRMTGQTGATLGFSGDKKDGMMDQEKIREAVMSELKQALRPEFLNRVDEVVCFNQLSEENFRAIAALMLGEVREVLGQKNITLVWDESLLDHLVREAYSVTYGARNLRRLIQKQIEDVLAQRIVDSRGRDVKHIRLAAADGRVNIEIE